jgi:AcrR family transcriptional regulator
LWSDTVEAHRRDVRQAVMDTTWRLVTDHGLLAVTMSRIAEEVGVGRATLYKYFPDVEAILFAHHHQHVVHHLTQLRAVRDQADDPVEGLRAVLTGYAQICRHRQQHGTDELMRLLHRGTDADLSHQQLDDLIAELIASASADSDAVNAGVAPGELASYCRHALEAASTLTTDQAVDRLVAMVLRGLGCADSTSTPAATWAIPIE